MKYLKIANMIFILLLISFVILNKIKFTAPPHIQSFEH